jgi:hypothetical protein
LTARRNDATCRGVNHSIRSLIHVSKFVNAINTCLSSSGLLRLTVPHGRRAVTLSLHSLYIAFRSQHENSPKHGSMALL